MEMPKSDRGRPNSPSAKPVRSSSRGKGLLPNLPGRLRRLPEAVFH
jgi:hypothetical protein